MRVTAETKTATRRRILETAKRLFARHGFETATTRDIARLAQIAAGTLFNYFPTKEAIVACLVSESHSDVAAAFAKADASDDPSGTLEEELFAFVAAGLRRLKPYRKYLSAAVETSLSALAVDASSDATDGAPSLRVAHLETVSQILIRRGQAEGLGPVAAQLYWTLYVGLLSFWAQDSSPKQEDTLALLDESLAMFMGWLAGRWSTAARADPVDADPASERPPSHSSAASSTRKRG